ncbi:hypothetical protein AgCh_035140 [Apium graveolens]
MVMQLVHISEHLVANFYNLVLLQENARYSHFVRLDPTPSAVLFWQCLVLVDYYALFFSEISSIEPADFCQKVNLCEQVALNSQHTSKNSCELCHYAIAEALIKLKDPDTELDIIEVLLKACKAVKGYETKCKRMVFEYGPLILINAEQWLESNDICNILHACDASKSDYSKHLQ